jgi:hypothetical protein
VTKEPTDRSDYDYIVSGLVNDMVGLRDDLDCMIRAAEQALSRNRCAHEWVDMRNSIILSGSMCKLCGLMRSENVEDLQKSTSV